MLTMIQLFCSPVKIWPKCGLRIVVLVEGKYEGRVAIASTASEYPLADFRFRGTPAPKHENCLLG